MLLLFHLESLGYLPFVHSDEAWLASLTRTMLRERSFAATEEFFHLTERHPHAIKSLFHLLQAPFVALSFSHVTVRALSLLSGAAALCFLYRALRRLGLTASGALFVVLLLGADVQFSIAGHLARQEILLVAVMSAAFSLALPPEEWSYRRTLLLGSLLGVAIGLHPNAFIVALPFFALIAWVPGSVTRRLTYAALLAAVLAFWAGLYLLRSLAMDPEFFSHYFAFGEAVGVADSPLRRLLRFRLFFVKLYRRIAGTYYLPPVRTQLLAFAGVGVAGPLVAALLPAGSTRARRRILSLLSASLAVLLGLYLVGKFAPPSVVLLWPPAYLLFAVVMRELPALWPPLRSGALAVTALFLLAVVATPTVTEALRFRPYRYADYRRRIEAALDGAGTVGAPAGTKVGTRPGVLANLNTAFAFAPGVLHTYRDLANLDQPVRSYLKSQEIRFVLLPSEMQVIYDERPQWNLLYGNLYPYYPDLREYLESEGELIARFPAPVYAMRIVPYMMERPAYLAIYRLPASASRSP